MSIPLEISLLLFFSTTRQWFHRRDDWQRRVRPDNCHYRTRTRCAKGGRPLVVEIDQVWSFADASIVLDLSKPNPFSSLAIGVSIALKAPALGASTMTMHELRLLEIETARVRHSWAKTQIESAGATPALTNYLRESLNELGVLRANDLEMGLVQKKDSEIC